MTARERGSILGVFICVTCIVSGASILWGAGGGLIAFGSLVLFYLHSAGE